MTTGRHCLLDFSDPFTVTPPCCDFFFFTLRLKYYDCLLSRGVGTLQVNWIMGNTNEWILLELLLHSASAVTYFVWEDLLQSLSTQPAGLQLLPGLLGGLAPHQSLCLGQEVGYQDLEPHQSHRYSETEQDNVCFALSNTEYLLILNIIQITCHHYHLNINIPHDSVSICLRRHNQIHLSSQFQVFLGYPSLPLFYILFHKTVCNF